MCDYSLMHVKSRPAKVEDVITTSSFPGTISRGFTPTGEPNVACCVLPGTEISFTETIKVYNNAFITVLTRDTGEKLARFRQIDLENKFVHHDALELANGETVLLHMLVEGQTAIVLQLPAAPKTAKETKAQRLDVIV